MHLVIYLALGSNLGDRESYLRASIFGLSSRAVKVTRCASVYLTEPRDVVDQPWFLNTVIEANTALEPDQLLAACMAAEQESHRSRDREKGPRTIDIDIIFYETRIIQTPRLTVPHPHYAERRFVLEPLAELASDFVDPVRRKTVRELLEQTTDTAVIRKVAPPLF